MIHVKVLLTCEECSRATEGLARFADGRLDVRSVEEPGWKLLGSLPHVLCPDHRFPSEAGRDG